MANFYKKSPSTGNVVRAVEKKNQLGRSMIEMLGVLAIIGVLSVAGIAGYSKAMEKHKINKAVEQISMIVANVQMLFSNTNDFSGIGKAYSLGVFPSDMEKISETSAYNVFGGTTDMWWTNDIYDGGYNWGVNYYVNSHAACVALLSYNWGASFVSVGYYKLEVDPLWSLGGKSISEIEAACGYDNDRFSRGEYVPINFEFGYDAVRAAYF